MDISSGVWYTKEQQELQKIRHERNAHSHTDRFQNQIECSQPYGQISERIWIVMEIERKFLIKERPGNLSSYVFHQIEQGYLCTAPVVRIRRQDSEYYLTYKSKGLLAREEYNLPLTEEAYMHLRTKVDGNLIAKKRYLIPLEGGLTVELDVFEGKRAGLLLAEVEFKTEEDALAFLPPAWLGEDVTYSMEYHNSVLSQKNNI